MTIKNMISSLLVIVVVSFAQSADSTVKSADQQQDAVTTMSTKTANSKQLSKQKTVKETTTWSKIKDLFM